MEKLEINVFQLKELIDQKQNIQLVDVREHEEVQICHLPGYIHIPLGELSQRFQELDPSSFTVVYCRSGMRSFQAVQMLLHNQFEKVKNLHGGIIAWSAEIDPTLQSY